MGYFPYYCVFCENEQDNGWQNKTYSAETASTVTGKSIEHFIDILKADNRRLLSLCDNCISKLRIFFEQKEKETKDEEGYDSF